jgi:hypothetical protein
MLEDAAAQGGAPEAAARQCRGIIKGFLRKLKAKLLSGFIEFKPV